MLCEHLIPFEQALIAAGILETYRGKPWGVNCREWVYYDCYIDTQAVLKKFNFSTFVREHIHRGTHDGSERGIVCYQCNDAIIGSFEMTAGKKYFHPQAKISRIASHLPLRRFLLTCSCSPIREGQNAYLQIVLKLARLF